MANGMMPDATMAGAPGGAPTGLSPATPPPTGAAGLGSASPMSANPALMLASLLRKKGHRKTSKGHTGRPKSRKHR